MPTSWLSLLIKDIVVDGVQQPTRGKLALVAGAGFDLSVTDSENDNTTTVTLAATGGSGVSGEDWFPSAKAATTVALPAYTRTLDTIDANANGAFPAIDGVTINVGDDFVLQHGASHVDDGPYTLTAAGSGGSAWSATRRSDFASESTVTSQTRIPIEQGTTCGGRVLRLAVNDPIVVNVTTLSFVVDTGLADGTAVGQVPRWDGTTWTAGAVNLADTDAVTGVLAAANGGTGLSALGTAYKEPRVNAGATALEYTDVPVVFAPVQDWATLIALVNAQAALGRAVQMGPGTWNCNAKVDLANYAHIIGGPLVVVDSTLAYGGVDPFNAPFEAGPVASGVNTTLAAAPTVGALTVSSTASYSAGSLISIQTTSLRRQYYEVKSVAGGGPYTLTLDRPIRDPYPNGATVMGWTSIVRGIRIDGRGMRMTGTADRYVEIAGAWDCEVSGIHSDALGGNLGAGSIAFSFDIGCLRCVFRDIHVDSTGAAIAGGVIVESGERCLIERCNGENLGTSASATAVALYDSWDSALVDCHGWGCYYGAAFTGANGCHGCTIRGGSYWSNTYGIIIGNGTRNQIDDVDCAANTSVGIYVVADLNPQVSNVRCQGDAIGIDIGAGTTGARLSNVYLSKNSTRNLYVRPGSGKTVDITGLRIYVPSGNGTTFILHDSGDLRIRGLDIDDTAANVGVTTISLSGSASMAIDGGTLALGAAVHGIYNGGSGVVRLHDVIATGVTNGYTGANASGGTLRMSGRCALTTNIAAGAYINVATIVSGGTGAAQDVTWPDIQTTDHVTWTRTVDGGVPGVMPLCTKTAATKFTATFAAGDTSTYEWRVE